MKELGYLTSMLSMEYGKEDTYKYIGILNSHSKEWDLDNCYMDSDGYHYPDDELYEQYKGGSVKQYVIKILARDFNTMVNEDDSPFAGYAHVYL